MPLCASTGEHRDKLGDSPLPFSACVARSVGKREAQESPAARAALAKEWDRLRKAGCWDESKVTEWDTVSANARRSGAKAHVGMIFEICVEKGSELPPGDPSRKYKGRVVFQGNRVKDENWNAAMFSELGSAPATMQAGKSVDAYGVMEGNLLEQCDAEQAYIQSKLGSDCATWVRLPKDRWPPSWRGMSDPVCPLVLALYGHPESGGWWERHCSSHLKSVGFVELPDWRSCFWHKALKLLLIVYVDDFKMAGPTVNLSEGWGLVR
jgi:hypothetical protein